MMRASGFHSDWVSYRGHRYLLECRAGFPDERMRFIATVAVWACEAQEAEARLVKLYFDDKHSSWTLTIASPKPDEARLAKEIEKALQAIFSFGNCQVEFKEVSKGNPESDHYHHMEHLSIEADVAADRFKYKDAEYMRTVEPPR